MPHLWCASIRTFSPVGVQGRPPEGVVPPQKSTAGGPTGDHSALPVPHSSEISSPRTFSCNRRRMMAPRVYQLNVKKEVHLHRGRQLVGKMLYGRTQ